MAVPFVQVGDIVHYTMPMGPGRGEVRGAHVTRVLDPVHGKVELLILISPFGDGAIGSDKIMPRDAVPYNADGAEDTWRHRPARE